MPYTVSTPVFEGPLDLLLHLVTKQQVDLWQVSLAEIVDQFLEKLGEIGPSLDLETATQFLLVASVLVELKTRRLLPGEKDAEPEEELVLWEERDMLLARLLECKTFKDAAGALEAKMRRAALSRPRPGGLEEPFASLAPDLLASVQPRDLATVLEALLAGRPEAPQVSLDHVTYVRASVAEAIEELCRLLPAKGRLSFSALCGSATRMELIVRFLAALELYKQGRLELHQDGCFGELELEWLGGSSEAVEQIADEYQGV